MNENTVTLSLGGRDFKLIGTAHVSRESCEEVKRIINEEKPDMVCVELDQSRYESMTQKDTWEKLNLSKVFREGKGFLLIANLVLASFQRRLGNELGVKPGEEMRAAIDTSKELGIPYSLCDREVHTTLRRAWAYCGFFSKLKLLSSLLASAFTTEKLTEQEIENLKNRNELDGMMNEVANYLPSVKKTLIDERDKYLAAKIWNSIPPYKEPSQSQESISSANVETFATGIFSTKKSPAIIANSNDCVPNKKIVAVVGAGHMNGMVNYLEKLNTGEETADVSELDIIPPRTFFSKISKFIIPLIIVSLVTIGFINNGREVGFSMMLQWLIWNGSLAAIGATIALAHPLAILVSLLGAPLTSLNPFIGVGIVSGLVQVTMRKPRVVDAQNISADAASLKGWYSNRITRTLLVFFLSSIGSSIGTFVAIPAIINRMF